MHIGINAQLLSFSQNYRNGGISRYIRYLLTALANLSGSHEYTIFVNGQDVIDHLCDFAGKDVTGLSGKLKLLTLQNPGLNQDPSQELPGNN